MIQWNVYILSQERGVLGTNILLRIFLLELVNASNEGEEI